MSTEIRSWVSETNEDGVRISVSGHVKDVLSLNFHDFARLRSHKILIDLMQNLHSNGKSAVIYGVGNFGFKHTHYFSPMTTDGKIEGHSNDPANDHDFVVVTNAELSCFKRLTSNSIRTIQKKYQNGEGEYYYPWSIIKNPQWNTSNFNIPSYCSVKYINRGHENETRNLMELHWLKNKLNWQKDFFSKYSPWYSTHVGCPIISITEVSGELNAGIWQPFHKDIDKEKPHQIKLSTPEVFGKDPRDVLQATRIVLAIVQATFADNNLATLSSETKKQLKSGVKHAASMLNNTQRSNANNRLKTILHRTTCLQDEIKYEYGGRFSLPNPFVDLQPVDLVIKTLDEIGWGKQVLGKSVKDFLN